MKTKNKTNFSVSHLLFMLAEKAPYKSPIGSTAEVIPHLALWMHKEQECAIVVLLDGAGTVIKVEEITKGLVDRSFIHPREVFREAIRHNAVSIILAHNHPSGSVTPSDLDIEATRRIKRAADIIGIVLLDHIIIGLGKYASLREVCPESFLAVT